MFSNSYYQLSVENGVITIKDAQGFILCNWHYTATYGEVTNGDSPVLGANQSSMKLRDASIFNIGDEIEIVTKNINEKLLHVATVVDVNIAGNTIQFSPETPSDFSIPPWNSQSPVGTLVRKITSETDKFSSFSATEMILEEGKEVIFTGETPDATVEIRLHCENYSPNIGVVVTTTYKGSVKVFNESLALDFTQGVSQVFRKNRKTHTANFADYYWLGNQGAVFGSGSKTCLVYHAPEISSLELHTAEKRLVVNLDDMRDHRYRRCDRYNSGYEEGMWVDRNAAEFNTGSQRVNKFALCVGMPIAAVPRLMVNPYGYLATVVIDSHADSSPLRQQRAVAYGHEDIYPGDTPVGGLVKHNIPVTNSYFYGGSDYSFRGSNWATDPDMLTGAFDIACDLYDKGFDICLHSIFPSTGHMPSQTQMADELVIQEKNEAMPFMQEHFDAKTWIDHSPQQNSLNLTTEGLIESSPAFLKELWEQHGVRYFWTHSSEDVDPVEIDLLGLGRDELRSPLYWRHPTVLGDFVTRAVMFNSPGGQGGWRNNYGPLRMIPFVENWGVSVFHNYLGRSNRQTVRSVDGKFQTTDEFEEVLANLAKLRDSGVLNVTTARDIMDYWMQQEKISFNYISPSEVEIINNGDVAVKGLSFAIDAPYYSVAVDGARVERKVVDNNNVFHIDIENGERKVLRAILEPPYRYQEPPSYSQPIWSQLPQ